MTPPVRPTGLGAPELGYDIGESEDSRLPVDCEGVDRELDDVVFRERGVDTA